jgi:hypothetical protein
MKKLLFLFIALFSYGNMCKAQTAPQNPKVLMGDSCLKSNATASPSKRIVKAAPKRATGTKVSYWLIGKSYFDASGNFTNDNGANVSHRVDMTFDGDSVTIEGLVSNDKFDITATYPVKGYYDAKGKTITIKTPAYDTQKDVSEYLKVATMKYYNIELTVVLFSGTFIKDNTGQYGMNGKGQLVFDISDDDNTITAENGFGCYGFNPAGVAVQFLDFYKNATLTKFNSDIRLISDVDNIDLTDKYIYPGVSYPSDLKISNASNTDTKYTVTSSDPDVLTVSKPNGEIKSGDTKAMSVTFSPKQIGDFNGTLTFKADNNNEVAVHVTANVKAAPEYSKIVKNGDFTFETSLDAPYLITDTITGAPVAVSTNIGESSSSSLIASFSVPEGKTGFVSWKGFGYGTRPNGVVISLNGETVLSHTDGVTENIYDGSSSLALKSGDYTLEFLNRTDMDWYSRGYQTSPTKFYVYDLNLITQDMKDNNAMIENDQMDMGRHYLDKLNAIDTAYVTLVNIGKQPLKVNSIKGGANFGGVVPSTQATYLNKLIVPITFTCNAIGSYEGDVVLSTTAGDFTVKCKASAEKIIYDYSPIVKSGDFSFNTSFVYPFLVKGSKAYNCTTGRTDTKLGEYSWLEASFVVPEGKSGVLAWSAYNSSNDYFTFMDEKVLTDGTIIYIDGTQVKDYAGEMDASSTTLDPNLVSFGAGRHTVKFLYMKKSSTITGDDKVDVYNLSLTLSDLEANKMSVGATDFSLNTVSVGRKSFDNLMLTNEGSNELKVTEIVPDGDFKGYVPAEGAKTFSTMPVVIYFAPTKEGLAQGNVVVKTTAGDVTVKCKAIATSLDGTPIYDEEFENGYKDWTLVDGDGDGYNFVNSTYQTTTNEVINAHNSNNCLVSVSWDGKLGGLTHAPNNYAISPAITIPAAAKQVILDYFFNLRGTETHDVLVGNGSDVSAYKSVFSDSRTINSYEVGDNDGWVDQQVDLSAYAGKTIQLAWRHYESSEYFKFDDVLVYYKTADGINTLDNNSANGTSEIFNANGVKMQTLTKGINIVRTTAADGTVKTRKIVVK